jgi:PAS domain-containing protein
MSVDDIIFTPDGGITRDNLLGILMWYSVPEQHTDHARLRAAWLAERLPPEAIPDQPKPVSVFQRACRSVETRRGEQDYEIKVDQVINNADRCVYQVTRMDRDRDNELIEHRREATIAFDRRHDALTWTSVSNEPEMAETLRLVEERYHATLNAVPASEVRAMVRDVLAGVGALNVRGKSGGVYFVPIDEVGTIESLHRGLGDLFPDAGSAIHMVAIPDNRAMKDMVRESHDAQVQGDLVTLMGEIREKVREGNGVHPAMVKRWIRARKEMASTVDRYRKVLDEESDLVTTKLEVLDMQLKRLLEAGTEAPAAATASAA